MMILISDERNSDSLYSCTNTAHARYTDNIMKYFLLAIVVTLLSSLASSLTFNKPSLTRRAFASATSASILTSLLPSSSSASPPPPSPTDANQEKSLLSTFSYPEPEPFVLRNQQLKIGKGEKPLRGAGSLKEKKK